MPLGVQSSASLKSIEPALELQDFEFWYLDLDFGMDVSGALGHCEACVEIRS